MLGIPMPIKEGEHDVRLKGRCSNPNSSVVVIQENTVKDIPMQGTIDLFHADLHLFSSSFFNRGFPSHNHLKRNLGGNTLSQYRHVYKSQHSSSR
jgi:hypothetical protein